LNLLYGDFEYWVKDKAHQGITDVQPSGQWDGFVRARIGILERSGILRGGRPLKFLEIGCSEGMLLHELKKLGHEVLGCEMNPAIADKGRTQLGVDIRAAMFEDLDLPWHSYDVVMSFHTIEHVKSPRGIFERAAKLLKPDGCILVEVPCGAEEYNNTDHLHFFCKESLTRLIRDCFEESEIIDNSYTHPNDVVGSLYGVGRRPKRD
jgi:SAM-dependent methyltransferase